jgi:hypothetical protein
VSVRLHISHICAGTCMAATQHSLFMTLMEA